MAFQKKENFKRKNQLKKYFHDDMTQVIGFNASSGAVFLCALSRDIVTPYSGFLKVERR